jgi:hypothetical protein
MPDGTRHGRERLSGLQILAQLRVSLSRDDIARDLADYGAVTGHDASLRRFHQSTGGRVDLRLEPHRVATVSWLRAWGCGHLRRADTGRTAAALRGWWNNWSAHLPAEHATLPELAEAVLIDSGRAYDALRLAPAARRNLRAGEVDIAFGPAAAAKVMFAVRPQAFLPWETPIRRAFGWSDGSDAYLSWLRLSAENLEGLARRLRVAISDLPAVLGRPESSPPKLIHEYLWIRVAKARWTADL